LTRKTVLLSARTRRQSIAAFLRLQARGALSRQLKNNTLLGRRSNRRPPTCKFTKRTWMKRRAMRRNRCKWQSSKGVTGVQQSEDIPWIGGFIAASASLSAEREQQSINDLQRLWLQEHREKANLLNETLADIFIRLENFGDDVQERIESPEYLALVRTAFRGWDSADTEDKRQMFKKASFMFACAFIIPSWEPILAQALSIISVCWLPCNRGFDWAGRSTEWHRLLLLQRRQLLARNPQLFRGFFDRDPFFLA
jgi:hypothetical protein